MMPFERTSFTGMVSTVFLSACLVMAGCSTTALPPGKSVLDVAEAKAQDPLAALNQPVQPMASETGFVWEQQVLTATGRGSAPTGMPAAQGEMVAMNSARVRALAELTDQVRGFPVGTDQTVGSIMSTYLTIRHAIEQEIAQQAQVSGQRPLGNETEVQVTMSMQGVARILQQHQITTDQELPIKEVQFDGVPAII